MKRVYIVGFKVHSNTAVFATREAAESAATFLLIDPEWRGIEVREMDVQDDWSAASLLIAQVKRDREARGR